MENCIIDILNKIVTMLLKKSKGNFDGITSLNVLAWNEVNWWNGCIHNVENDIVIPPPELFITTDASLLGWGAVYEGKSSGGQWNDEESLLHINALELTAIFFGLKSFLSDIYSRHIRIKSDNTTAIAYINNKGGVKLIECHEIAKNIWEWAIHRNIHLSAEHIPGSKNVLADKASRVFNENTEWTLDLIVFF